MEATERAMERPGPADPDTPVRWPSDVRETGVSGSVQVAPAAVLGAPHLVTWLTSRSFEGPPRFGISALGPNARSARLWAVEAATELTDDYGEVLVVDLSGDPVPPEENTMFPHPGLVQVVRKEASLEEAVHVDDRRGIAHLDAGGDPDDIPSALVHLLNDDDNALGAVVVALPPLGHVVGAASAAAIGHVVLLVEAGTITRDDLSRAARIAGPDVVVDAALAAPLSNAGIDDPHRRHNNVPGLDVPLDRPIPEESLFGTSPSRVRRRARSWPPRQPRVREQPTSDVSERVEPTKPEPETKPDTQPTSASETSSPVRPADDEDTQEIPVPRTVGLPDSQTSGQAEEERDGPEVGEAEVAEADVDEVPGVQEVPDVEEADVDEVPDRDEAGEARDGAEATEEDEATHDVPGAQEDEDTGTDGDDASDTEPADADPDEIFATHRDRFHESMSPDQVFGPLQLAEGDDVDESHLEVSSRKLWRPDEGDDGGVPGRTAN